MDKKGNFINMTKKTITLFVTFMLAITLAGCGSSEEATNTDRAENPTRETPLSLQLMLGTVLLDKTDHAISAEQATELLPLWKVLNSLSGSEWAAQAEVDSVIESIQEAMTDEQMAAIEGMELSMADSNEVMEILGIETNFGGRFGEMDPEMQATIEAMRESGEVPEGGFGRGMGPGGGMGPEGGFPEGGMRFEGGFPEGGMGPGGGEAGLSPEIRETAMAERGSAAGGGFGINSQLLEAIIAFLEAKVQ